MNKCPYCFRGFQTWKSVRAHLSKCKLNIKTYIICLHYGSLSIQELNKYNSYQEFKKDYPLISFDVSYFRYLRKNRGLTVKVKNWANTEILDSIKSYYKEYNRLPQVKDFEGNAKYPGRELLKKRFGSFNKAILEAGFIPNIQNGYGINTYAKDKQLYDSGVEAHFVDHFLFEKEEYEYYKPYGNGWFFDFYLPKHDLYIEIDGEFRDSHYRQRILDKIKFCKDNNLNLKVITKTEVYSKNSLLYPNR